MFFLKFSLILLTFYIILLSYPFFVSQIQVRVCNPDCKHCKRRRTVPTNRHCNWGLKSNGTETYAKPTATGNRWFWLQSLASFTQ